MEWRTKPHSDDDGESEVPDEPQHRRWMRAVRALWQGELQCEGSARRQQSVSRGREEHGSFIPGGETRIHQTPDYRDLSDDPELWIQSRGIVGRATSMAQGIDVKIDTPAMRVSASGPR